MNVYVTWGYGNPIKCPVYEVEPEGDLLLFQLQYRQNRITGEFDVVRVPSPALGLVETLHDSLHPLKRPLGIKDMNLEPWRKNMNNYLDETLETNFETFPACCFQGQENAMQRDLLTALHNYYLASDGRVRKRVFNPP